MNNTYNYFNVSFLKNTAITTTFFTILRLLKEIEIKIWIRLSNFIIIIKT